MIRIRTTAAAATAAAAITAAAIAASAGGQTAPGSTITLTEVPKGASFGFVDNPPHTRFSHEGEPRKLSVGDLEVESIVVADQQGNRRGRFDAYCVITRPGVPASHEEECTGTYRLTDGSISALGSFVGKDSDDFTAAITGGTGAYAGARGSLKSVAVGKSGKRTDTINLLP
jgi:hypothetical protein